MKFFKKFKFKKVLGFTLIETLVVVAVFAAITTLSLVIFNPKAQLEKGNDARRQGDLSQIKTSLDAYYNDNNKYPDSLSQLNSNYIKTIPRDPSCPKIGPCSNDYVYLAEGINPQWYVLFSQLKSPEISTPCPYTCTGIDPSYNYCSFEGSVDFNYCRLNLSIPPETITPVVTTPVPSVITPTVSPVLTYTPTPTLALVSQVTPTPTPIPPVSCSADLLPGGTFSLIGTHPYALTQSTDIGRVLDTMIGWNGKLYIGYGDYTANTGPIQIAPFDPVTKTFAASQLSAKTEAIYNFRVIGNSLYAPAIDPLGTTYDYAYAKGEPWVDPVTSSIDGEHIFDVASLDGSDLYAVGSRITSRAAAVWRSTGGGSNWTLSLNEDPVRPTDYARFYFAGVYNGKLYVQAQDMYSWAAHPNSKVFDGKSWSSGPSLFPSPYQWSSGWRPEVFAGQLVYKNKQSYGVLLAFDGSQVRVVSNGNGSSVLDFTIEGDYLYLLEANGKLSRTKDFSTWENVSTTVPADAMSLAFLNGVLYIGASNAKLYVYAEPSSFNLKVAIPISAPCTLLSVAWGVNTAVIGKIVTLNVTGDAGCTNKAVTFEIHRYGLGDILSAVFLQPDSQTIVFTKGNNTVSTVWNAEYNPFVPFTSPQYYFKATVDGKAFGSELLNVTKQ